jgi:hypothetical protein
METKNYENKVIFLRKSKKGEHLYAFDYNGAFAEAKDGSLILNVSDVQNLIDGKFESIKVSVMPKKEEAWVKVAEGGNATPD